MITQQPTQPQSSQSLPKNDKSYIDEYQPPKTLIAPAPTATLSPPASVTPPVSSASVAAPVVPPVASKPEESKKAESLQDQNIFFLLGVEDGDDDEKEAFLDELQQVIWEDFIETDTKMLISANEMTQLRQIMAKGDGQDIQEEMVVYLEKLIPDLEEIMLEKALELKEDMVWERISGMREYYAGRPESLAKIDEAEQLAKKDQWHQAAEVLNAISK